MQRRVSELSCFGDTLKKQHLRNLERENPDSDGNGGGRSTGGGGEGQLEKKKKMGRES